MRFYITTLGCPKNTVDSEMMAELLLEAGHTRVEQPRRADVLIANTCAFIAPAREESYQVLDELAAHKRPRQFLVVAGCLAQRYEEQLRAHLPQVDAILGTQSWPEIVRLVEGLTSEHPRRAVAIVGSGDLVASVRRRATSGASAYLKIADGCDAACAFCAIPVIKGPQRSKPLAAVLREAQELAAEGVREIVLIAQDTTAYGKERNAPQDAARAGLCGLVRALAETVPQVDWLRILYAYPQHVTAELIATMASLPQVCHYLDLPLQHGHPDVLRRMRRPHDIETVYRLIEALRQAMPDIALRSTFIVGYPGETEAEFEGLLDLMRQVAFDKVGVFAYSAEEGTLAATLSDQVPAEVIAERYERAMLLQQEISWERNQEQIGRTLEVLIEGVGEGLSIGRSYRDAPEIDGLVLLAGELPEGELLPARIVAAQEYDLIATPLP